MSPWDRLGRLSSRSYLVAKLVDIKITPTSMMVYGQSESTLGKVDCLIGFIQFIYPGNSYAVAPPPNLHRCA